ncbi:hypothetical protein LTR62_003793 [Meristemomyces frigidus]|uniref:Reverse transcriptase domain-containing protein n=1 Tax=Meristemomyces frigidus TaxID=1508187 RepID=A0AAN7TF78_9PEZI|nr:hypothetical protein LTR62_003793 [Meristemomyces frigidus]
MAPTGSLYSQTLQDITNTKLDELAKRREIFERYHKRVISIADKDGDVAENLVVLSDIIKASFGVSVTDGHVVRGSSGTKNAALEIDLQNLDRFLAQAKYDPTVNTKTKERWLQGLLRHVRIQSLKYTYASLYGRLTTEWLGAKTGSATAAIAKTEVGDEDVEMGDYEHVSSAKKLESRAKWEQNVFTAASVDVDAIKSMLGGLYEASPDGSTVLPNALQALRAKVAAFEQRLQTPGNFNQHTLAWVINGLLDSDLLTDEKRDALRDFQGNAVILSEVADVLNMRVAALKDWSWGDEVPLEERRQLNGGFNIYMHEDLLQALFLQYIGVKWSVFWKSAFREFRRTKDVWESAGNTNITAVEKKRREFYLGHTPVGPTVSSMKMKLYRRNYFVSQLFSSENQKTNAEEGEEEADFDEMVPQQQQRSLFAMQSYQAPQSSQKHAARTSTGGQAPRMQMAARASRPTPTGSLGFATPDGWKEDDEEDEEDTDDDDDDDDESAHAKNPMAAKQGLLHLLSTDIMVKTRFYGELACFRSQIDNLYPSLPHASIKTVLSYLGVSPTWLQFFTHFLEAPLRFADESSAAPRQRKNGTPGSHVLSEVFAEVILFNLDLMINQKTEGEILWRLRDDFWFWSADVEICVTAWSSASDFLRTMGLGVNSARTGSVKVQRDEASPSGIEAGNVPTKLPQGQIRWGMLCLEPSSGRFEIDQEMVNKHTDELSRQLKNKGNSVFAFIQVWNSYATRFFTSNFGKPANCFGRQHVDNMLATHRRIQQQVFTQSSNPNSSFVDHLKQVLADRHGVTDIPDGYFYFPTSLGGLDITNPFITLLQVRDNVVADHAKLFSDFLVSEKEGYRIAKHAYETGKTPRNRNRVSGDPNFVPEDPATFMPVAEYTKYREELPYTSGQAQLGDLYKKLLGKPSQQSIETVPNGEILRAVGTTTTSGRGGPLQNWSCMQPYWKWVAELYGPEMIERFGGFEIVDAGLLPMGMVALFRSGRVKWQE